MDRKKILVVEDEHTTRRMLSFNLKQQGYDVFEAEDGAEGLEMAHSEKPDLILLDIMMPGENGFEVCKKIRSSADLSDTPIVILTARAGMADKKFAFKAGADEYLTKPVSLQKLNKCVGEFLQYASSPKPKVVAPDPGIIVPVFSPHRKMGSTTLAIKLSEVMAKQQKHPVVLIDLALPIGDVAPRLGLNPRKHIGLLLSQPTSQITIELAKQYMQRTVDGYQIIPAPAAAPGGPDKVTPDNLRELMSVLIEASYITIFDLGSTVTELNLAAIQAADKTFVLTSGQPADNEALDNFMMLIRKLGLDLARLFPVINQLHGPVGGNIVLARSPVARIPYIQDTPDELSWANELALQKLSTIITG